MFPAVPNRWLIIRRENENTSESWIVESDYLHPVSTGFQEESITYPIEKKEEDYSPDFRYLGRQLPLQQWSANNASEDYLERLTAVGYGEPTFAAFYPNCRSVFGFHDPKFSGNTPIPDGLTYDVMGWYSDPEQNYLSEFIEQFKSRYLKDYEKNPTLQVIRDAIAEEFKWKGVTIGSTPESIPADHLPFPNYLSTSSQLPRTVTARKRQYFSSSGQYRHGSPLSLLGRDPR